MIINSLDMGSPSHPFAAPILGQTVGSVIVEGSETIVWPRGSIERKQTVSFWIKAWQGIGGKSANTTGAMQYLLKQVEELVSNRDVQPVYIQWTASADPAAQLNATELHDGWYIIDDFEPDYSRNVVTGLVQCRMTVTEVAAAAPRSVSLAYQGAALSTNFSGSATNLISLPVGSTALEANFNRTGAEGAIPCILSPAASPEPTVLSATLANIFKGGVHVYDTINTGSNPVPTSGGTFVNANWVEVFWSDHDFAGDCVITNGLLLLLFQTGQPQIATVYLWNTALAAANWQQISLIRALDTGGVFATLQSYSLVRLGPEECSISPVLFQGSSNSAALAPIRLQRGRYELRWDFRPLTGAVASVQAVVESASVAPKISYNSGQVADVVVGDGAPGVVTDYGYAALFAANSIYPHIYGFLYQNQPGTSQPAINTNNASTGSGDGTSLAINASRSYGFFASPYGVSGTYSTANLQAEAESGTLGTGWSSIADAAASAGNTANLANATGSGNADLWGASFVPAAGVYDLWVRMKATTHTSATAQLQIGLWDATSAAFVASTTYAPNQVTGSYAWYRVAASVTPTATHNMQVRAVTTATTTDAWQLDESALVPHTLTTADSGPQDIWQAWMFDRSARLIRP